MPPTLDSLLHTRGWGLRLLTAPPAALSSLVSWVHSSDLADPTPYLDAGQLLLTDGSQFPVRRDRTAIKPYRDYAQRLAAHGIVGLGFATQVIHAEVPNALVQSCESAGLPLFEVPNRTPFIAIIRHVADLLAAEQRARLEWSSQAQRAITRAALRPDSLQAIMRELEDQLSCWSVLLDSAGVVVQSPRRGPLSEASTHTLLRASRESLKRGSRASARISIDGDEVLLQTLGQRGRLRGVLALGGLEQLDPAGTDLVTSVIALASLALERNRALDDARRHLREGILQLLAFGQRSVAEATAEHVWEGLPDEPLTIIACELANEQQLLHESLELLSQKSHGQVFFAPHDDDWVVLAGPDYVDQALAAVLTAADRAGSANDGSYDRLLSGIAEARLALQQTAESGSAHVEFQHLLGAGMLGLLRESHPEALATALLQPLVERDAADNSDLLGSLRVWFDHNGSWDAAAAELGVHRHTLRNRVNAAARTLDLNLDSMRDRVELWTALQFAGARPRA